MGTQITLMRRIDTDSIELHLPGSKIVHLITRSHALLPDDTLPHLCRLIINCGIERVVCERKYHTGAESEEMFKTAGVKLEYVHDEVQKYNNQ